MNVVSRERAVSARSAGQPANCISPTQANSVSGSMVGPSGPGARTGPIDSTCGFSPGKCCLIGKVYSRRLPESEMRQRRYMHVSGMSDASASACEADRYWLTEWQWWEKVISLLEGHQLGRCTIELTPSTISVRMTAILMPVPSL